MGKKLVLKQAGYGQQCSVQRKLPEGAKPAPKVIVEHRAFTDVREMPSEEP